MTLVFFIGGVTFTEIAALRYMSLAEQPNRYSYIFLYTKLYQTFIFILLLNINIIYDINNIIF